MQSLLVNFMLFMVAFVTIPLVNGQVDSDTPVDKSVSIPISVWVEDKGFAKSLVSSDFEIFEGKTRLDILSVSKADEPLSIGILFDLSGSVNHRVNKIPAAVSGLTTFLANSHLENEYFLMSFAEDQTLLVDTTQDRTRIEKSLSDLAALEARGNTRLYDAMEIAFGKTSTLKHAKKAIIVVSDGQDTVSKRADFDDIIRLSKREDILLYLVNIQSGKDTSSPQSLKANEFFQTVMTNSGGRGYFPKMPDETDAAFRLLAAELRSKYFIEVRPINLSDRPRWRGIKLKLSNQTEKELGKVLMSTKKGFYL